jgi:hypothetical protein
MNELYKWGLIWTLPRWMWTDVMLQCRSAMLCDVGTMCNAAIQKCDDIAMLYNVECNVVMWRDNKMILQQILKEELSLDTLQGQSIRSR